MSNNPHADPVTRNLWHPLAAVAEVAPGVVHRTTLLDTELSFAVWPGGGAAVWHPCASARAGAAIPAMPAQADPVACQQKYGYLWACFGDTPIALFPIPEYGEPDRRNMNAASIGTRVSAPRAIENFLDMGHFPFVHTGYLGAEPHTEVRDYDVRISDDENEILATRCKFFQPMAAATSTGGADVDYIYRVPHPYCAILYKSSPADVHRKDVIAVFLQPMTETTVRAHMLLSVLDNQSEDKEIKRFQQTIFGQDKPILENQRPKRLPLDPRAEVPIRADKSAIVYRRWLSRKGITYGVIPAAR